MLNPIKSTVPFTDLQTVAEHSRGFSQELTDQPYPAPSIGAAPALHVPNSLRGVGDLSEPPGWEEMQSTADVDAHCCSPMLLTILAQVVRKVQLSMVE